MSFYNRALPSRVSAKSLNRIRVNYVYTEAVLLVRSDPWYHLRVCIDGGIETLLHEFPLDGLVIRVLGKVIVFPRVVVQVIQFAYPLLMVHNEFPASVPIHRGMGLVRH